MKGTSKYNELSIFLDNFEKYKSKKINPSNATQSGPMLVINNKHHPAFNHGSSSRKLRSGVGIMPNGKLVFLISNRSITNFHDFATIFKDIFGDGEGIGQVFEVIGSILSGPITFAINLFANSIKMVLGAVSGIYDVFKGNDKEN